MSENETSAIEQESGKQPPKPRAKKAVAVNVLDTRGQSALVEWTDKDGAARRCYMPKGEIDDGGKAPLETLEGGIPYGAPWAELAEEIGLPAGVTAQFAGALHRRGVWTAADLERNPKAVSAALVEVTGITASALRRAALSNQDEKQEV